MSRVTPSLLPIPITAHNFTYREKTSRSTLHRIFTCVSHARPPPPLIRDKDEWALLIDKHLLLLLSPMGIENLNSPPLPSPPLNLQEAHSEIVFGGKGMEFRAGNETKVTRRDEIETVSLIWSRDKNFRDETRYETK